MANSHTQPPMNHERLCLSGLRESKSLSQPTLRGSLLLTRPPFFSPSPRRGTATGDCSFVNAPLVKASEIGHARGAAAMTSSPTTTPAYSGISGTSQESAALRRTGPPTTRKQRRTCARAATLTSHRAKQFAPQKEKFHIHFLSFSF